MKKLNEGLELYVSSKNMDDIKVASFEAESVDELVRMVKFAGINQDEYDGLAMLNSEDHFDSCSVSAKVFTPNMRSLLDKLVFDKVEDVIVDETADFRIKPTEPKEFGSSAGRQIPQPNSRYVPAKSGDNPITIQTEMEESEEEKSLFDQFKDFEYEKMEEVDEHNVQLGKEYPNTKRGALEKFIDGTTYNLDRIVKALQINDTNTWEVKTSDGRNHYVTI